MTAIGFVGTGVMGRSMAGHLLAAGHALHVFNRTREKARPLVDRGATWHDTPGAVAAASDVVITMVGLPADVVEVYFGGTAAAPHEAGILGRARPGTLLIDMTTSSPRLAERIAAAAGARGLAALDAPVTGGDVGARDATLVIMVGGAAAACERAAPRALAGDFAPGFMVKHLLKDLAIARECAAETGLDLPGLATAERLYTIAAERGWADDGTQALYRLWAGA